MGERIVAAEFGEERGGLRALPVEQRRLLHHRGEAGELGLAPAGGRREGFVNDGHGAGGFIF